MLVLQRNVNESVVIEGVGTVTVVQLRGNRVRLGFEMAPEFKICRAELPDRGGHLRPLPELGAVYSDGGYPVHVPQSSTKEECSVEDRGVSVV